MNGNFDTIYTEFNGSISNANIASDAAIATSKLATDNVTTTSTSTMTNKTLTKPKLVQPYTDIVTASDGATVTFNLTSGHIQQVTLGGDRTLAISNEQAGQAFVIRLIQDGTGSRTVTWFSTIKWPGGTEPTLSTDAGDVDVFAFICTGTDTYDGFIVGQDLT